MLHAAQRICAPNSRKVSINTQNHGGKYFIILLYLLTTRTLNILTAVWALICVHPTILAPFKGLSSEARFLKAKIPGISSHRNEKNDIQQKYFNSFPLWFYLVLETKQNQKIEGKILNELNTLLRNFDLPSTETMQVNISNTKII